MTVKVGRTGAKYIHAPLQWSWQYVFPSNNFTHINFHGERRRHHAHPSSVQRAVKGAVRGAGAVRSPFDSI
jgi:hypothetical protein